MYVLHSGKYTDIFAICSVTGHLVSDVVVDEDGLDCPRILIPKLQGIYRLYIMRSARRAGCSKRHYVHLVHIRVSIVIAISPKESLGTSIPASDQHLVEHLLGITADSEHSWQGRVMLRPLVQRRI